MDTEVVDWFKSKGPGYQTRINRILRRVMMEGKKRAEVVGDFGAANNSWGWNFTKAFFGGLVSSAGWKAVYHSFGEGGCDRLMVDTFAEAFNPLGSAPGVSDAAELALKLSGRRAGQRLQRTAVTKDYQSR